MDGVVRRREGEQDFGVGNQPDALGKAELIATCPVDETRLVLVLGDLDERPAIAGQIEPKLPPESFRRPAGRLGWAGEVDAQVHAALYGRQELNTRLARRRPARPRRQDLKVRRVNARTREDEPSV